METALVRNLKNVWLSLYNYMVDNEVSFKGGKRHNMKGGQGSVEDALEAAIFATLFTIVILFRLASGAISSANDFLQSIIMNPGDAIATLAEDENLQRAKDLIDSSVPLDMSTIYAIENNPESTINSLFRPTSLTASPDVKFKAVLAELTEKLGSLGAALNEAKESAEPSFAEISQYNRKLDFRPSSNPLGTTRRLVGPRRPVTLTRRKVLSDADDFGMSPADVKDIAGGSRKRRKTRRQKRRSRRCRCSCRR